MRSKPRAATPDALVEQIYASVEDPRLWAGFLKELTFSLGATVGALVFEDLRRHTAGFAEIVGQFQPDLIEKYQAYYASRNPWMEQGMQNRAFLRGDVIVGQQLLHDSRLARTEYYNDLLVPSDLHHLTGSLLLREPDAISQLSILRPRRRGPFVSEVSLLRRLAPHLRRAFRIHQNLSDLAADRAAISAAMDLVPLAVVVFGRRTGGPLRVNRRAFEIFESGDGLSLQGTGFVTKISGETQALRRAIEVAQGKGGGARSVSIVAVVRPSGRHAYSVIVSPLLAGSANLGVDNAAVIVLINDPNRPLEARGLWVKLYGFTPAEASLAARLLDGEDLASASEA